MGVLSENAIIGASAAGDYDIDYSCRFNDDSAAYLSKTFTGTPTLSTKATISLWWKRGGIGDTGVNGGEQTLISWNTGLGNRSFLRSEGATDQLQFNIINGSGTYGLNITPVQRDVSAWYHIVGVIDTTQVTSTNRMKLYINGEQVTAFDSSSYPAQDETNIGFGEAEACNIGRDVKDSNTPLDGYLAEVNFIDGQALTPSSFGETDVLTNEWKAKKYGGAYGTNGFFLEFKEGGMITYDREAEIAVTSSFTWVFTSSGNTSGEDLVNGLLTNNDAGGGWMPAGNAADRWIKFDFVTGKIYKACQWISINSTGGEGTWKWQGSNDDAAWTDIGGTFTLGGSDGGSNVTYNLGGTLNANTTSYRYYRILGISGTVNTSGRRLAMYFSESVPGLGNDNSGNGNNYTPTNLTATDQMIDTPQNSTGGNWCTLNFIDKRGTMTLSEGNLKGVTNLTDPKVRATFMLPDTGKWYWEFLTQYSTSIMLGVDDQTNNGGSWYGNSVTILYNSGNGFLYNFADPGPYGASYGASWTTGDIIGVAYNRDDNEMTFYKNNSAQPTFTIGGTAAQRARLIPFLGTGTGGADGGGTFNFGQDSSFAGVKTPQNNQDANDIGDFYYAPPAGYLALCSDNALPDPSIALPTDHFNTILWTGDGTSPRSFTGVGFTPDLSWTKNRTTGVSHQLYDTIRGAGNDKELASDSASAEGGGNAETYGYLSAFGSDGFTTTDGSGSPNYYFNENTKNFVSWNWKANGAASNNTDGTTTSSVSANTTAGFSIVSYAGSGSAGATVGHGLSQTPDLIIIKNRTGITNWVVNSPIIDSTFVKWAMKLDITEAISADTTIWNSTAPSASVFTLGTAGESNRNNPDNYIAYCFHSVEGYSKIGTYDSNNSTDGPFIYLGFTPAFIMLKCTNATDNWNLYDIKRDGFNGTGGTWQLRADGTDADFTSAATMVDLVSNGMKIRTNDPGTNGSSRNYLYLAFAESPFKTSRAR